MKPSLLYTELPADTELTFYRACGGANLLCHIDGDRVLISH